MNNHLVPGILALFILISFFPASAGTEPVNLSISSAAETGGYITAEVTGTATGVADSGYLGFWLDAAPGDCSTSRLLGWQVVPSGKEPFHARMKSPVPSDITPGTYELQAGFTTGTTMPEPCSKNAIVHTTLVVSTPGTGVHDMAATLPGEKGESSGPDYRIEQISGVDSTARMAPSSTLTPSVAVSNGGADDSSDRPVEIHAYLGSEELIPVIAIVEPMKGGESRDVQLSYKIPATIPQNSYPFFLIIDPRGEHGTSDAATNLKRTGGQMKIRVEEEDPLAGHGCGCT